LLDLTARVFHRLVLLLLLLLLLITAALYF
jgi:hypothetical protein